MNPLNLGLIGLGNWAREAYLPILKDSPGVRVAGVAAPSKATQEFAREQLGAEPSIWGDYHDLLVDDTIQAVAISLPGALHASAIEASVAARKHVFFEPPIGLTAADIGRVLQTLSETDRVVQPDLELRYLPVVEQVRDQLASGNIGHPLMAKVRLWTDWGYGGGDWSGDAGAQGFFLWLGCWYLDVLDCVLQAAPTFASVVGGRVQNGSLTDHGWATLSYRSGSIGQFEFSLVSVEETRVSLHVLGTSGQIEADLLSGTCRRRRKDEPWQETHHPCAAPVHGFAGMRESIADFVSAVAQGNTPKADLHACGRVHEAALACARAETENRIVPVEPLIKS